MAKHATGYAPGKLILCGEHAVVYGHPAIAFAINLGTTVTLTRHPGPTHRTDDGPQDPRLAQVLDQFVPPNGIQVHIRSELPMGCGMGSSASLAVALVRARAALDDRVLTPDQLCEQAMAIERVFHGNPSGLDHTVSSRQGALWYRRGPPAVFEPVPCPTAQVVVLSSGLYGHTAQLVAQVAANRPAVDGVLQAIGQLVAQARQVVSDPLRLGPLLTQNHRLLVQLGVSHPVLDELVALALQHGAYGAKLAGAGGGGVVLALTNDPAPLLQAAASRGFSALRCHPVEPP